MHLSYLLDTLEMAQRLVSAGASYGLIDPYAVPHAFQNQSQTSPIRHPSSRIWSPGYLSEKGGEALGGANRCQSGPSHHHGCVRKTTHVRDRRLHPSCLSLTPSCGLPFLLLGVKIEKCPRGFLHPASVVQWRRSSDRKRSLSTEDH